MRRADNAHGSDGFVHGDGDAAHRGIVHAAVEFVGPGRVGKNALDAETDFLGGLFLAHGGSETTRDFRSTLRKIFGNVIEDLRAIVSRGFGPGFRFASGLDGVADVLAIAEGRFAEQFAFSSANLDAVAGIRANLFAADVLLHGAV